MSAESRVAAKRTDAQYFVNNMMESRTIYYATFEFISGDRLELRVSGEEYGMLAEGDAGVLTFQGTRYLGFERGGKANAES